MIRVFEAFAGVGSQRMALRNIGIEHEVVAIAEIDKYAIKSYEAVHGKVNNLGDISKIETNTIPDHDLFTYSFPCQDISTAGLRKGFKENSGTRSSLLWECRKVIEVKKPKWLLMENVKNLVGKKFKKDFDSWCEWLESQGYTNYWQVLNAKDYGIPQNRERVFMISIKGAHRTYHFPEKQELTIRLTDVLEKEVDSKFYLKEEKVAQFIKNTNGKINLNKKRIGTVHKNNDMSRSTRDIVFNDSFESPCLTATMHKDAPKIMQVGNLLNTESFGGNPQRGRIYSSDGLSPSLNTVGGGGLEPKIIESADGVYLNASKKLQRGSLKDLSRTLKANNHDAGVVLSESVLIKNATKKGYSVAKDGDGIDLAYPKSNTRRGRVQNNLSQTLTTSNNQGVLLIGASRGRSISNPSNRGINQTDIEQRLEINKNELSNTLTTVQKDNLVVDLSNISIRKLTPKECWRLMGFKDEDFEKASKVVSNSQLYKQAGNSIVVNVLEAIFSEMFIKEEKKNYQTDIFDFIEGDVMNG